MKFSVATGLAFIAATAIGSATPITTSNDGPRITFVTSPSSIDSTAISVVTVTPALETTMTQLQLSNTTASSLIEHRDADSQVDPDGHFPRVVVYKKLRGCRFHIDYVPNWVDETVLKNAISQCERINVKDWEYYFDTPKVNSHVKFSGNCLRLPSMAPCMDQQIKNELEAEFVEWQWH